MGLPRMRRASRWSLNQQRPVLRGITYAVRKGLSGEGGICTGMHLTAIRGRRPRPLSSILQRIEVERERVDHP